MAFVHLRRVFSLTQARTQRRGLSHEAPQLATRVRNSLSARRRHIRVTPLTWGRRFDPHALVDFALTFAPDDHTPQLEAKRDNDYVRARANAYMARRFRALRAGKSTLIVGHL